MNYSQFKEYAKRGYTRYPNPEFKNVNGNVIELKEQKEEMCNKFQFMCEE